MDDNIPVKSIMLGLGIAGGFLVAWQGLHLGTELAKSTRNSVTKTVDHILMPLKSTIKKIKRKTRLPLKASSTGGESNEDYDSADSGTLYSLTAKGRKEYLRGLRAIPAKPRRRRRRVRKAKRGAKRQTLKRDFNSDVSDSTASESKVPSPKPLKPEVKDEPITPSKLTSPEEQKNMNPT